MILSSATIILSLTLLKASSLLGVSAFPFKTSTNSEDALALPLPRDISHIALDERTGHYLAFKRDGSFHGRYLANPEGPVRRQFSTCTNLTVDEAETLPGWNAITQYADDNWGTGSRNIVTNPDEYPDRPAEVCITDETVDVTFSGDPVCQSNNITTTGQMVGTNGTVAIEVDQGFTADTSYTVSTAASIGVSSTLSVKVGVPEVADVTEAITMSTDVTNTQTNSFSATYNDVSKVTVTMQSQAGKTCNAVSSVKSCTLQATGKIRYLASGYIWFNYDDRTDGHYKWAVNIESVLSEDDRSSFLQFKGSVAADTHSSYSGTCV